MNLLLGAALGLLLPSFTTAEEPASPEAYQLQVSGLKASDLPRIEPVLRALDGVNGLSVPADGTLAITTSNQAFLPESTVKSALKELGLNVESVTEPGWARMPVYVVQATGGA